MCRPDIHINKNVPAKDRNVFAYRFTCQAKAGAVARVDAAAKADDAGAVADAAAHALHKAADAAGNSDGGGDGTRDTLFSYGACNTRDADDDAAAHSCFPAR